MIKFFRKIRYDLMGKNKTGQYFKYAIGEVLLVVLGILIAVQINTWNQSRKRLQLEKVLLEQLKSEMVNAYDDIWEDLNRLERALDSHYKIIDFIEDDLTYVDSLCFDFYWIKKDEYIYPPDAVYGKIKEEGLDIIRNDSIRSYLQIICENDFPRLMKNNGFYPDISDVLDEYYLNNFRPNVDYSLQVRYSLENDTIGGEIFSIETFSFPEEYTAWGRTRNYTIGFVPLDFEALKKDTKFQMLLVHTDQYRKTKVRRYKSAKRKIKKLVDLIDEELNMLE